MVNYGPEVDAGLIRAKMPDAYIHGHVPPFLLRNGGPEEIRQYKEVLDIVGYFLDKRLPLGAMCHGPQVVWAARSVKGRQMTAYYGIRADLEMAGAKFLDQPTVIDAALVTSRGWPDLPDFMPKFLKVLAGK